MCVSGGGGRLEMHYWLRPRLVIRARSRLTTQQRQVQYLGHGPPAGGGGKKGSEGGACRQGERLRDGEENRAWWVWGGGKIVVRHNLFIGNVIEFGGSWLEVETQPQSDSGPG